MRHKIFASLIAVFVVTAPASAQEFSPHEFRSHVSFLGHELLEGRETGTRGYDIAARYVASRFESLGLAPASKDDWFQEIPFVRFQLTSTPAKISIEEITFTHLKEIFINARPEGGQLALEAEVVFAGYGLDAPNLGLTDYSDLEVRGKVVAVLSGTPKGLRSDVAAHLNQDKRRSAAERGAVGMLVIRSLSDSQSIPWERVVQNAPAPGLAWLDVRGNPHSVAPGLHFTATLGPDAANALFAGAPRPLHGVLQQAADGGRPTGFSLPARLRIELESERQSLTSQNVVAVLPGSDPDLAHEYVMLTAHLDGLGIRPDGEIRPGAIDNATGISALLEAARALATSNSRPRRSILFAALTAEEKGLLGSQYLARNPVVGGKIVGLVNLDMPILLYDFVDVIAFGAEHSTMGPIVERAAARMGVALTEDPLPEQGLFTRSDHYMFVREGVPSVFLMTGFGNGGEGQFKSFLAGAYHSPQDNLEQPIDWEAGARFARLNYLIAREIADADKPPQWYEDSFFGQALAPAQDKAKRR